jgi:hypothetical protein
MSLACCSHAWPALSVLQGENARFPGLRLKMEAAVKIPLDATISRSGSDNADAPLPRRSRTRKGKARLLTLASLDLRTAAAQTAHALIASLVNDLGGSDRLSAGELQLVTRAALTGAIVGDFEARWVAGQQVALGDYLAAVNVQRRVLTTLVDGI